MNIKDKICIALVVAALFAGCAKNTGKLPPQKEKQAFPYRVVHFQFDADETEENESALIRENAEWMKKNRDTVVILEGYCDEQGDFDYNMHLGDRRARTVKAHLIENGISYDRIIMVVSYGEERPLDTAHRVDAWMKNRRVEFVLR